METLLGKHIVDLVQAGLAGESGKVELIANDIARSIKLENPEISENIEKLIGSYYTGDTLSAYNDSSILVDGRVDLKMATIIKPNALKNISPILDENLSNRISIFLDERNRMQFLLEKNLKPSTSLLLTGQPGNGKKMLAKYIASILDKELVIIDLSTSIAGFLDKKEMNLFRVLNYAKKNAAVLYFEKFHLLSKQSDDVSEMEDIQNMVEVIMSELDSWPVSSIFIASCEHFKMLRDDVWKRFDHLISIPQPQEKERLLILEKELSEFLEEKRTDASILKPISELFKGKSAEDICKYANKVKRRNLLTDEGVFISLFEEIEGFKDNRKTTAEFCVYAKEIVGDKLTVEDISKITGLSQAGVQFYITKS